jgi:uncharacterized protein (DUF1330 family)
MQELVIGRVVRGPLAGYFVLQIEWKSVDAQQTYVKMLGDQIAKHGGEIVVASRDYRTVEGTWRPGLFLIIRFPTMEALRTWYDSEEYRPARDFRLQNSRSDAIIVEGE